MPYILCILNGNLHVFAGTFGDPDIIHVDDVVVPVRDLETITEELQLKVLVVFIF